MALGGLCRRVLRQRPQNDTVPGLSDRRRERVALASHDFERARKLGLDDQHTLVLNTGVLDDRLVDGLPL